MERENGSKRMKRLTIQVDVDQYARLKQHAASQGRTLPAEIRMAIDDRLERVAAQPG